MVVVIQFKRYLKMRGPPEGRDKMIKKLSERQNHRCCYCGCRTFLTEEDRNGLPMTNMATKDHIKPRSKNGRNKQKNLIMSCSRCNGIKDSYDAFLFYEYVKTFLQSGIARSKLSGKFKRDIYNNDISFLKKQGDLLGIEI